MSRTTAGGPNLAAVASACRGVVNPAHSMPGHFQEDRSRFGGGAACFETMSRLPHFSKVKPSDSCAPACLPQVQEHKHPNTVEKPARPMKLTVPENEEVSAEQVPQPNAADQCERQRGHAQRGDPTYNSAMQRLHAHIVPPWNSPRVSLRRSPP